jgi:hypothetical protein
MNLAGTRWFAIATFLAVLAGMVLLLVEGAGGTTLKAMSVSEMTRDAAVVVRVRCVKNSTGWDAGEIWTYSIFAVEETWKGAAEGQLRVRLLGGRTESVTSTVAGVPRFRPGEEVVLFLEPTSRGDFSVVGWMEGTFRIRREASGTESVTQDTAGVEAYDPVTRRFVAMGAWREEISRFKAEVLAASANSEGGGR